MNALIQQTNERPLSFCFQLTDYESKSFKKDKALHPLDIDAYWIQRKLSEYYKDSITSQARAKDVLDILQNALDDRDFENRLVLLLGVECFEFIKILKKHRQMSKLIYLLLKVDSQPIAILFSYSLV